MAWVCGLLTAAAATSSADPGWGRLEAPAAGDMLHPGDVVEIRWGSLPVGLDEFELLLSVDGGASFPVRLTPQLDPGLRSVRWRVPNLSAPTARLRLRVGIDGYEIDGPPGPVFAIAASPRAPASGLEHRAGEWWLAEQAVAETPSPPSPRRLGGPQDGDRQVVVACGASKQSAVAPRDSRSSSPDSARRASAGGHRVTDWRPSPEVRLRP